MIDAGKLNKRISIKSLTRTADGIGGFSESWALVASVWASIMPVSTREKMQYQAIQNLITHRVIIRYRESINQDDRIYFGSRVLRIAGIRNLAEQNELLELVCEELEAENA